MRQLISRVEEFSTNLFDLANEVQNSLDRVQHSISTSQVKMNNVAVSLTNAAEDQYLENRVERPPELDDEAFFKTRRKRKDDAQRALILEETAVAASQIERMRTAVHTAIDLLSLREGAGDDAVSVPESDAVSKHPSLQQAGRSSFQLRLPPNIGDARFASNRYLGLVVENLDPIEEDIEDVLSRASVYHSASVLQSSQATYENGTASAIPQMGGGGGETSAIPQIGATSAIPLMDALPHPHRSREPSACREFERISWR